MEVPDGHLDEAQALVVVACGESPTAFVCNRPLGMDGACLHGSNCRIKALISSAQALVGSRSFICTDLCFSAVDVCSESR